MTTENTAQSPAHPIIQPPGAIIAATGMSIRDVFAANVDVSQYAAEIAEWRALVGTITIENLAAAIAAIRYAEADAMLAERAKIDPPVSIPDAHDGA